ncbi:MAG: ferredoxin [Bacteriovoracia bacterium]
MYKAHLFICTNDRTGAQQKDGKPPKGSCAQKGSLELRDKVKASCKGKGEIRVNAAGCLGYCSKGIAAVLYPQEKWFFDLTSGDTEKLVSAVDEALR